MHCLLPGSRAPTVWRSNGIHTKGIDCMLNQGRGCGMTDVSKGISLSFLFFSAPSSFSLALSLRLFLSLLIFPLSPFFSRIRTPLARLRSRVGAMNLHPLTS